MLSILKGPKDAVLSGLGRLLINKWGIAKYGAMTSLALDAQNPIAKKVQEKKRPKWSTFSFRFWGVSHLPKFTQTSTRYR